MKRRLVILTELIAPYRIPVFNALAGNPELDLHVIFLSETDASMRQWRIYSEEIRFSYEVLPSWRRRLGKYNVLLNQNVTLALRDAAPEAVLCGGYNYVACWQAALGEAQWDSFSSLVREYRRRSAPQPCAGGDAEGEIRSRL